MTFQLQPGDYIRTASVPDNKKQAVIGAFVKAGCPYPIQSYDCNAVYDFTGWWKSGAIECFAGSDRDRMSGFKREVTLDQILGKPMLIEALKPGDLAKINPHGLEDMLVEHRNGAFMMVDTDNPNRYVSNISYLTTTDYEIIPADPVPWMSSEGDFGWYFDCGYVPYQLDERNIRVDAFRTREGAEQAAKIMKVVNAICNMPGYGGDTGSFTIYWWSGANEYHIGIHRKDHGNRPMVFRFDTEKNAEAAAKYANNMIRGM